MQAVEISDGATGSETLEGERSFTRVFRVATGTPKTSIEVLSEVRGVPKLGHVIGTVLATSRTIEQDQGSRLHWRITYTYTPEKPREGTPSGSTGTQRSPWHLPPEFSFDSSQYQRVVSKAYLDTETGDDATEGPDAEPSKPIQNSAGVPFDPPVQQEYGNIVIRISRNQRKFDPDSAYAYQDSINSNRLRVAGISIGKYEGRMRKISGTDAYTDDGQQFWKVSYEIEVNRRTHLREVLDAGFAEKEIDGSLTAIEQAGAGGFAETVSQPSKLDGEGAALDPDAEPVYLQFRTFPARDWSYLDLPYRAD